MSAKKEFGDFQTPDDLAKRVVSLVRDLWGDPNLVIEPTVGLGSFLKAATVKYSSQQKGRQSGEIALILHDYRRKFTYF